jgi:immune inhibitor A
MAAKTGKSPRAFKHAPSTQTAKLLTVLVEFNPNANDDFSGFERPAFVGAEDCVTEPPGTLLNGPLHNNLPDPATFGRGTDNNTPSGCPTSAPATTTSSSTPRPA